MSNSKAMKVSKWQQRQQNHFRHEKKLYFSIIFPIWNFYFIFHRINIAVDLFSDIHVITLFSIFSNSNYHFLWALSLRYCEGRFLIFDIEISANYFFLQNESDKKCWQHRVDECMIKKDRLSLFDIVISNNTKRCWKKRNFCSF